MFQFIDNQRKNFSCEKIFSQEGDILLIYNTLRNFKKKLITLCFLNIMYGDYSDSSRCRIRENVQNIRIRNHHRQHHDGNSSSSLSSDIEIYVITYFSASVPKQPENAYQLIDLLDISMYIYMWLENNSVHVLNKAKTTVINWV